MVAALAAPRSAGYCLHAATRPFREAVAAWCETHWGGPTGEIR